MEKIYSNETPKFLINKNGFQKNNKKGLSVFYLMLLFLLSGVLNVCNGQSFTPGNLAVFVAASASASNTTGSIVELNTTSSAQTAINTFAIPSSTITLSNQLRFSGSATSTCYIANSNDGSLLCFTGSNTINSSSNVNSLQSKGVGTYDASGTYTLQTTYTGTGTNQARGTSSLNNSTWFIGDQGGFYSNGTSAASPSGNIRSVKAFGGTIYAFTASATAAPVGIVSAATGGTYAGLPGLANGATSRQDFYLISSGSNGSTFDVLYVLDATSGSAGTIFKYSLVSGSWTANGTYTTSFGGFGMTAQKSGIGANLFVSSGTGATAANSLIKLNDAAGYNATINITTGSNVTLYTAAAGTTIKGVAFAPVASGTPTLSASSVSSFGNVPILTNSTSQSVTFTASNLTPASGNITVTSPSTDFQVSNDNSTWGSSTIATYTSSGTFTSPAFYVRFTPQTSGLKSGNVTLSGGGVSSPPSIAVSGTGQTTPTKLAITSISPASPIINSNFSVTVQSQDGTSIAQSVVANTNITLSVTTGTGTLLGTLTGTITAGTNSVVIPSITYNVAETGIVITATRTSGDILIAGSSSAFAVLGLATKLVFVSVPTAGVINSNIATYTVECRRADNSVDPTYTGSVVISKASGPGVLSGTLSVNAVAGIATFSANAFDQTGTYTLSATSGTLTGAISGNILINPLPSLTSDIMPQYIQGLNGTNSTRIPYAYVATIHNLIPNATYRYFNSVVLSSEVSTSNGAGNCIFPSASGFLGSSGPNLSTAGNYGTLTADASGNYTGLFVTEPSGNATRFIPGNNIFMRIMLNDGASGTTVASRVTSLDSTMVINFGTTSGTTKGTGIRGTSSATAKNFIFIYDNVAGTGRPIAGTYIEDDGFANTSNYATFYSTPVNGTAGSYGTIIPNINTNGVRRIEQRNLSTCAIVGCAATDADGIWPSGANTVNPLGGTTAIILNSTDAPLDATYTSPTITSATSNSPICTGGTLNLSSIATGTPTPTYSWSGAGSFNSTTVSSPSVTSPATGTYTITVTNACSSVSSNVSVLVNTAPVITCPSDINTSVSGSCGTVVTYAATATGTPAPIITYSIPSGAVFNAGATAVTATATNSCGSVNCTFNVTVTSDGIDYWTGVTSSDWFDASNWCGGIPTATTDLQISSGVTNMPTINNVGAICRNLTINSGATLSIIANSNLNIKGNLNNDGTFNNTGGVVNFNGSSAQTITGTTTFYEMDLNNTFGLTLGTSSDLIINHLLNLVDGIITTNTNIITISDTNNVSVTDGYVNGNLKKYFSNVSSTGTFEIGSGTAYTPLNINFNTISSAGYLTVNTVSSDHPSISTSGLVSSKTVNRYWNLVGSGLSFDYYNLDLTYANADKDAGFIEMYAGAKIYSGSSWHLTDQNSDSLNILSVTNATVLGAVQIGVFNPTPVLSSLIPIDVYLGQTGNIVFNGTGFINGVSSVNSVSDITTNSTIVNNDTILTINVSVSPTAVLGTRKFAVTNLINAAPQGGTSDSLIVTIRKHPVASFFGDKTTIACYLSGNVQYNNYSTDGASYYWDFGPGATPATATGFGPYTVTYSSIGLKTVRLVALSPIGNDTLTRTNYINVVSNAPAIAASITGATGVCPSSTQTYSVPLVAGVTSYNWSLPSGLTLLSGAGTRTISVLISGTFASGNISITETNTCGTSPAKIISLSGVPAIPTSLTGALNICSITSATYTVATMAGATSYTWVLPTGVTSTSGSSPVTIPAAVTGANTITVNFAPTFISGSLSVKSNTACASSALKTLSLSRTLAAPTLTSTSISGLCPSGVSSAVYTCGTVAGASSYLWTVPTGATITAGSGTTSVTVSFGGSFTSGNITVAAVNACGTGLVKTLAVKSTLAAPTLTSTFTTGLCPSGVASAVYTCGTVAGASSYLWTVPTGASITAGAGTTSVTVSFSGSFTSGNITVAAVNACGTGLVKTLAVKSTLAAPTLTSTSTTGLCPSGVSSAVYTCGTVVGATSYNWTVPTGATITAGAGTTSVTVSFGASFTSGNITVIAVNACGLSPAKTLALHSSLLAPTTLTGPTTGICPAGITSGVYTCGTVVGATSYNWTVPTGATITAGAGTSSITVSYAPTFTSGSITVNAQNACGSGAAKMLAVRSTLLAPGVVTGSTVVCANATDMNYSILPVAGATSYVWTVPSGATITSGAGTNAIVVDFGATASGGITVKAINDCGNGLARSLVLSMTCMGTYSGNDKALANDATENTVDLYPNPTSENLNIKLVSDVDKDVVIEIFNALGSRVSSDKYSVIAGENMFNTNVSNYVNGFYFVHITDLSTNATQNKTFIKQ